MENGAHKDFPDQATAVGNMVFVAKPVEGALLVLVEENGDLMFAWSLLHQ